MSNYLTLELNSTLLFDQAQAFVNAMLNDAHDRTTTQGVKDYAGLAITAFNEFITSLGVPIVEPLFLYNIPIAEFWNTYQQQVINDLQILYNQYAQLATSATKYTAIDTIKDNMMQSAISSLQNKIASIHPTPAINSDLITWYVVDNFRDKSKLDMKKTTAWITIGNAELHRVDSKSMKNKAKITLDDEYVYLALDSSNKSSKKKDTITFGISNGFVGNTHEIEVVDDTSGKPIQPFNTQSNGNAANLVTKSGQTLAFVGDKDLRNQIDVILDDRNDTWFEYEVCNVSDVVKHDKCANYGFEMTFGNVSGKSKTIPWFAFHDGKPKDMMNPQASNANLFPEPPNTSLSSPHASNVNDNSGNYNMGGGISFNPTFGSNTNTSYDSGTNAIVFEENGAPETGGTLRLSFNIELDKQYLMSQITINPRVINGKKPKISSVEIRGVNDQRWIKAVELKSVRDAKKFANIKDSHIPEASTFDSSTWYFHPIAVKQIKVLIEQTQSYKTKIGHIYWIQDPNPVQPPPVSGPPTIPTPPTGGNGPPPRSGNPPRPELVMSPVQEKDKSKTNRVNGPEPSLENLVKSGIKGEAPENKTVGAVLSLIPGIESFYSGSKQEHQYTDISGPFLEYFNGWRYAIAINSIDLDSFTYAQTSVLQSIAQPVPIDIKQISLEANENIPTGPGTDEYRSSTKWITYEISLDRGMNWHPIAVSSARHTKNVPKTYYVNPPNGTEASPVSTKSIVTPNYDSVHNPANHITLRATITRPSSINSISPHLHMYKLVLKGVPQ